MKNQRNNPFNRVQLTAKTNRVLWTAFMMMLFSFNMSIQTAQAADANNYSMLAPGAYTATARVDESIGMRAAASIGTAVGITPMETRLIRTNATMVATNSSTLPVVVAPYARYTLNKVVVAAIATITHANGTKDAVKDIQTYTTSTAYPNNFSPSPDYAVPDFSGYVKSGDIIHVEVILYTDLTYRPLTRADCVAEIDLSATTTTGISTIGSSGSMDGITLFTGSNARGTIRINTSEVKGPVWVTGNSVKTRQIYVMGGTASGNNRRLDIVLSDATIINGSAATSTNYITVASGDYSGGPSFTQLVTIAQNTAGSYSRTTAATRANSYSAFTIANADVYMTLTGTTKDVNGYNNVLANVGIVASSNYAGQAIYVDASASLIVTDASDANLFARGGTCGAAIGSQSANNPAGFMEFDGGDVTAISAYLNHNYSGIGNGGHYGEANEADPGLRGFVMNGGKVNAMGFHYGIGGNGGGGATAVAISPGTGPSYLIVTGGDVVSESSAGAGGAAFGFAHNNAEHEVRIGRPDKGDAESGVTAVNWGYGAAISGKMTFYSGTTNAYSGQYSAAIGGNAVSNANPSNATATQAQSTTGTQKAGTPLTVYGGNVTAVAGAFTQGDFIGGTEGGRRGDASRVLTPGAPISSALISMVENQTKPSASYGAAIGGAVSKAGGLTNNIFAGTLNITSSIYGAGIGGGGAYSAPQSVNQNDIGGGDTWIGKLTDLLAGTVANMDIRISSGAYGAGIGGGGSSTGNGGNGGNLYINGGVFTIQSGLYGACIGGGGSLIGIGGSGGDLFIDCKTDESMIASWNSGAVTPSSFNFNIKSGQFGAGIGGGGSNDGNGGAGATTLTINGGNFNIEAGGSGIFAFGTESFGAGIGGGGSNTGNGGNGPANAEINGGYFNCSSVGYGAGIGGGGASIGTGGAGGVTNFNGGTAVVSIPVDADGESIFGSVSVGGGHADVSAGGISNTGNGEVFILGGSIYSKIKSSVNGDVTQHAWTLPNPAPTTGLTGTAYNTASTYIKVEVPAEEIGKKVDEVTFSYNTVTYPDGLISYGTDDLYILAGKNSANADIGIAYIWVPTEFQLTYDLTSGTPPGPPPPYPSPNDFDIDYANRTVAGSITLKMTGTSQLFGNMGAVPLLEWDQKIQTGQEYYGTTWGDVAPAKNFHLGAGNKLYELTEHAPVGADNVYLIGWAAKPVLESDNATEHIFGVGDGWDFSTYLINVANFSTGDITVYAMWGYDSNVNGIPDVRESAFSLSYDGNAGSDPVAGVPSGGSGYKLNDTETIPATIPTRAGYVFLGWTTTAMTDLTAADAALIPATTSLFIGGSPSTRTFGSNTVQGTPTITFGATHITLYILWAEDVNSNGIPDFFDLSFAFTYDANGGLNPPVDQNSPYLPGLTATVLTDGAMTRAGYLFNGWNTAANGLGNPFTAGDVITMTQDTLLYAQWRPVYVTYDANGGLNAPVDPNSPYLTGTTVTVLDDDAMTMPLYMFTHWNTKPDGSGTSYKPGATFAITSDITLYAQWHRTYIITYDANGGYYAPVDPKNPYPAGQYVTVLDSGDMFNPYYIFSHWNTKAGNYGTSYMPRDSFIITEDITLYAQWKEPDYTDPLIQRLITIAPSANGWVASDKIYAKTRDTVTLTIAPASGYVPDMITVHKTDFETIIVPVRGDGDIRTFIMPPYEVTVSATFIPYVLTGNTPVSAWNASVQNGVLYMNGLTIGKTYRIYNLSGALVYHNVAVSSTAKIPLPGRGVYIITDGNEVLKIVN